MAAGGLAGGVSGMSTAVERFQAATAAGFTISRDGGAALIAAIDDMLQGTEEALAGAHFLSRQPPLGTTPAAEVYKPFLASIAADSDQGFIPAVLKLQDDLTRLRANVAEAMGLYWSTDEDRAHGLDAIGGTTHSA
ncbi:hypothetical protein [Saccharothrix australiensis]|uniref:Excreted virulence factor EspC (Type VII ESX diderm) n=1 Tax=Saccharothrix australiensis TaxID=2072 RepID=A0A495W6K8_9PSEU|nr:hypothetical protein [Saccharothrix australiensis]RKT57336.1 hypothetical protein C8E97_6055 [Saccharothrix australiensis]